MANIKIVNHKTIADRYNENQRDDIQASYKRVVKKAKERWAYEHDNSEPYYVHIDNIPKRKKGKVKADKDGLVELSSSQLFKVSPKLWEEQVKLRAELDNLKLPYFFSDNPIDLQKEVAPFLVSSTKAIVPNENSTLYIGSKYTKKNGGIDPNFALEVMSSIGKKDFSAGLEEGKYVKISPFTYQPITVPNAYQSKESLLDGINNIKQKNGRAIVYDLETTGRQTLYGHGAEGPGIITEFSATEVVFGKDGKLVHDDKFLKENKTFNAIIGFSKKESEYAYDLLNRFIKDKDSLSTNELVTIDRLARAGHKKTAMKKGADGVYRYTTFASLEDLSGIYDTDDIAKGIADLTNIGKESGMWAEGAARDAKLVDFMGYKMFAHEAVIAKALYSIYADELTVLGHNINPFDNPTLSYYFNSEKSSEGLSAFVKNVFGEGFRPAHSLDDLAFFRHYGNSDLPSNIRNLIKASFERGNGAGKLSEKDLDMLMGNFASWKSKNKIVGSFTQEALMAIYTGQINPEKFKEITGFSESEIQKLHQGTAHLGWADAIGNAKYQGFLMGSMEETLKNDPAISKSRTMIADGSQVFFAANSWSNLGEDGMFATVQDNMTGELRTSDGFTYTDKGIRKEGFGQTPISRNTVLRMKSFGAVNSDNPVAQVMFKTHPDMKTGNLSFVTFTLLSAPGTKSSRGNSEVTIYGEHEKLVQRINAIMKFCGQYNDKDGTIDMSMLDIDEQNALRVVYDTPSGHTVRNMTSKDLYDMGKYAMDNDAAARKFREHSLKTDLNVVNYIHSVDNYATEMVKKNSSKTFAQYQQEYRDILFKNTQEIFRKRTSGEKITDKMLEQPNLITLLGYRDYYNKIAENKGEWTAYSNTIDKIHALEPFYRNNINLIESTLKSVLSDTNISGNTIPSSIEGQTAKMVYKMRIEALMALAEQKAMDSPPVIPELSSRESSQLARADLGYHTGHPYLLSSYQKTYQIDLTGFNGVKKNIEKLNGNIVSFDLSYSGLNFADKIAKVTKNNVENNGSKVALLKRFYKWHFGNAKAIENINEVGLLSSYIQSRLIGEKTKDPMAGIITPLDSLDLLSGSAQDFGLTDKEIAESNARTAVGNIHFYGISHDSNVDPKTQLEDVIKKASEDLKKIIAPDTVDEEELRSLGYSEHDIKRLVQSYEKKKTAAGKMADLFTGSFLRNGGKLFIDQDSGKVFIGSDTEDFTELNLIKERYSDGKMFSESSATGSRNISPMGLFVTGEGTNAKVSYNSTMGAFADDMEKSINWIIANNSEKGHVASGADYIFSKLRERYFSRANEMSGDMHDTRMNNIFDINDIPRYLERLSENSQFQKDVLNNSFEGSVDAEEKLARRDDLQEFIDEIKNPEKKLGKDQLLFSKLGVKEQTAIAYFGHEIISALGITDSDFHDYYEQQLSLAYKKVNKGYMSIGNSGFTAGMASSTRKRGSEEFMLSAPTFDAEKANAYLNTVDRKGISVGSNMMTRSEYGHTAGKGLANKINVNNLSVTTEDYRKIIKEAIDNGEIDGKMASMLTSVSLTDGASAMSIMAARTGLDVRTYEKQIRMEKLSQNAADVARMLTKGIAPKVTVNSKDGSISFTYSNGAFKHRTDNNIFIKGQGDLASKLDLKEDGIMQYRLYKDNHEVKADTIQSILNEEANIARIKGAANNTEEALRILQEKGIEGRLLFKDTLMTQHIKTAFEAEKTESRVIGFGLGDKEKKIRNVLDTLGVREKLQGVNLSTFVMDSLDTIERDKDESVFTKVINSYRDINKQLSNEDVVDAIKKEFKTVSGFKKAVYKEEMEPWLKFEEILKSQGHLQEGETIDMVSNLHNAQIKHGEISVFEQVFNDLREIHGHQEAAKIMKSAMPGLVYDENLGAVIDEETGKYSTSALDEIIEKYNLKTAAVREGINGTKSFKTNHTIAALVNFDKDSIKDNRFDDRDFKNLILQGYDKTIDKRVRETLNNTIGKRYGLDEANRMYNMLGLNPEKSGTLYANTIKSLTGQYAFADTESNIIYSDYINETNIVTKAHDKAQAKNKTLQAILDFTRENIEKDKEIDKRKRAAARLLTEKQKEGIKNLLKKGMSGEDIANVIKGLVEQRGATRISEQKVLDWYTATAASLAKDFNTGNNRNAYKEMLGFGFTELNINDINTDAASFTDENSIFNKNLMVSFKGTGIDDLEEAKVALPFSPLGEKDAKGELNKSQFQSKVAQIKNYIDIYKDRQQEWDDLKKAEHRDLIRKSVNDLKDIVNSYASSNSGITKKVSHTYMEGISTKANALYLTGLENDQYYGELKWHGKKLAELAAQSNENMDDEFRRVANLAAKSGLSTERELEKFFEKNLKFQTMAISPSFSIHSTANMEEIYSTKVRELFGQGEMADDFQKLLFEDLKENGTLGLNKRYPINYRGSTSANRIYFSDTVKKNTALVNVDYWNVKKGDFDSDSIYDVMAKARATITINNKVREMDIDYGMYRALQKASEENSNIKVSMDKKNLAIFEELKTAEIVNSIILGGSNFNQAEDSRNYVKAGVHYVLNKQDGMTINDAIKEAKGSIGKSPYDAIEELRKERTYDGEHIAQFKSYSAEERNKYEKLYDDLSINTEKNYSGDRKWVDLESHEKKAEMRKYIESNFEPESEDFAENIDALIFNTNKNIERLSMAASINKGAAGPLDVATNRLLNMAVLARKESGEALFNQTELQALQGFRMAIEESPLISKSGGMGDPHSVEDIKKAMSIITRSINDPKNSANLEKIQSEAIPILKQRLFDNYSEDTPVEELKPSKDAIRYLRHLDDDIAGKTIQEKILYSLNLVTGIGQKMHSAQIDMSQFDLIDKKSGIWTSESLKATEHEMSISGLTGETINAVASQFGVKGPYDMVEPPTETESAARNARMKEKVEAHNKKLSGNIPGTFGAGSRVEAVAREISGAMKGGHGIMKGAAAIVGGLMASGYASGKGGTPPPPATHQAVSAQSNNQQTEQLYHPTPMPKLSDTNLNSRRAGVKQGYVINISANSPKGRKAAEQAIMNATQQQNTGDGGNTSINITTTTTLPDRINQLQVGRMVQRSMGL